MLFCLLLLSSCADKSYNTMTFGEKVKKGYSVNILINGDSIAADTSSEAWTSLLANFLKEKYAISAELTNISLAGNGAFAGYTRINTLDNRNTNYDLIILCYGQNDVDNDEFASVYEAMVRSTIKKYPNAQIISILESSQKTYTNKIKTIMSICEQYGIPCVDTIEAFKNSAYNYEELTTDGIHLNSTGNAIYAESIYKTIENNLINNTCKIKNLEKPFYEKSIDYEYFCYIPISEFSIENGKGVIFLNEQFNSLGIDRINTSGIHQMEMLFDDESYDMGYAWNYDFLQRHIEPQLKGSFDVSKLQIYAESEVINNFNGIILTSSKEFERDSFIEDNEAIKIKANTLKSESTLPMAIINSKGNLQQAIDKNDELRNYTVYCYKVEEDKSLTISSKAIGGVNSIMRYAFYKDTDAIDLIKPGSMNRGGWDDAYEIKTVVPKEAKYLLVTCQNSGFPTVYYNEQKELYEELNACEVLYQKVLSDKGIIVGPESNTEYCNYKIYIYKIQNVDFLEIYTEAKANANTLMRYAFSKDELGNNIIKEGPLNVNGWEDATKTTVRLNGDENYLLVTCQNGALPIVIEKSSR